MTALRLDDLTRLLRECAGSDESVDLEGDVLDLTFADLGYDSLAILELTGVVEREHHIRLDEEAVPEADTPRRYLDLVNAALAARR
ncbi:acyl carrier protein [Streptomyces sp. NPDC000345]|uniref:acyl carrier protein n=1 Tax=unclassified Streptomyces TaxID=2593676 RepID=UPI0036B65C85